MKLRRTLAVLIALLAPAAAADDYSIVPDRFVYCTTCHGVELKGNVSVDAPRLNGMEGWYVAGQLNAFKQGWRGTHEDDLIGMEMQPQAAVLSDVAIQDAAAFVASVKQRRGVRQATVTGDAGRGKSLYATCAACHGARGEGSKVLNAPALTRQSDWYLLRQLENYRKGSRGYAAADTSGQQMRAAAATLADTADLRDVVAYINTLN